MRFRHNLTENNTVKRVISFLLMLCLLVPMLPSSIGLDAKAEDGTDTTETTNGTITITLHDLYIDRKEALPDDTNLGTGQNAYLTASEHARTITVEKGTKLSDALADKKVELGTSSLKATGVYKSADIADDKAMTSVIDASNCVWYTRDGGTNGGVDGNNARTKFESSTAINDNIDLYTYSYRIRLITGESTYKDLIVREGQTKGFVSGQGRENMYSISDFFKNVDNTWIDVNENKAADISALTDGITRNYAFRAKGVTPNTVEIPCKVAVNGQWTDAGTITMDKDRVDVWGRTGPALNYYVTDEELVSVYGEQYGFAKKMLETQTEISKEINAYFPFRNGSNMIIRQMPKWTSEGQFRIPLVEDTTTDVSKLEIYYTPHNTTEYTSNFLEYEQNDTQHNNRYGWASIADATVLKDNSFFTVDVDDTSRQYILSGESASVTVGDGSWKAVKWFPCSSDSQQYSQATAKYEIDLSKNDDGVTYSEQTFNISNIRQPIYITQQTDDSVKKPGTMSVNCYVLKNETWENVKTISVDNSRWDMSWGIDDSSASIKNRVYVTSEELETVYGDYGFSAKDYAGEWFFPHTAPTDSKLWLDRYPVKDGVDNTYHIPILDRTKSTTELYYIPNNKKGTNSYIGDTAKSEEIENTELKKDNTFYSVDVKDEAGKLGSAVALPTTRYFLTGTNATVAVPTASDVNWYGRDEFGSGIDIKLGEEANNQVSITIPEISCATILTTQEIDTNVVILHAFAAVDGEWKMIGTEKLDKATQLTEDKYYYITVEKLEKIYGCFGFSAKNATAETLGKQFARTTTRGNDGTAKAVGTTTVNGKLCVKTITQEDQNKGISLYYVPSNNGDSLQLSDSNIIAANNFYSISTNNSTGSTLTDADLPSTQYFRAGTDVKFSLPVKSGVEWYIKSATIDKDDCFILKPKNKTTSTLSVSKISTSIVLTATNKANSNSNAIKKANNVVALHCYALVNGVENEVSTVYFSTSQSASFSGTNRTYISTQVLENVYADYGFVASEYKGERYFPNTAHGTGKYDGDDPTQLWADTASIQDGDYYKIPLLQATNAKINIDVIYSPHNKKGYDSYFGENQKVGKLRTDPTFVSDNTFYTIDFEDPENKFSDTKLPDTQYALTGTDKTITLPYAENVNWFRDSKKLTPIENSINKENGTAKYTISNVTKATKITTDGVSDDEVAVQGYISLNGEWTKLSSMRIEAKQADDGRFYLTSDQLETLFGSCGFKASDYAKTSANDLSKYFPSSTIGSDTVSTTAGGKNTDGSWQVNTIKTEDREQGIAVYYTPAGVDNDFSTTDTAVLSKHTFYTITVTDDGKAFDSTVELPGTLYRPAGKVTITLPYKEGVNWTAMGKTTISGSEVSSAATTLQEVNKNETKVTLTITVNTSLNIRTGTVDKNQINLVSYVAINGEWEKVDTSLTKLSKLNWDQTIKNWENKEKGKFYITAEELEIIYGQYGFKSSDYTVGDTNTRLFANRTEYDKSGKNSDNQIWPDQVPIARGTSWYLPLVEPEYIQNVENNTIYVYYLPNNKNSGNTPYFNNGVSFENSDLRNANSFYTITLQDPGNKYFTEEELSKKSQLVLSGESTAIELPSKNGVTWKVTDKNGVLQSGLTPEEKDGKVTLEIPSVTQPLIVTTESKITANLPDDQIAVNAYVSIDDEWTPVATEWTYESNKFVGGIDSFTVSKSQVTSDSRYYLTAEQLESIFSGYELSASGINDKSGNHFPHSTIRYKDSTSNSIYADTKLFQTGGSWCVPFIKTEDGEQGISIYYTPKTTQTDCLKTDQKTLSENCFKYSMSAANPLNVDGVTLPQAEIFNKDTKASFTLPAAPEGCQWIAVNKKTGVTITGLKEDTNSNDGSITYSTDSITQPIQFILSNGSVVIQYTANLEDSDREPLGNLFRNVDDQVIVEDGTVKNQEVFAETVPSLEDYTTRAPDSDRVKITVTEYPAGKRAEPRDYYYTFAGWQIEGTNQTINSNEELKKAIGDNVAIVKLNAKWEALDDQKRPNTVNFYLSLSCEIMDNVGNGFNGQAKENFTTTIYSTRIKGTDGLEVKENTDPDSPRVFRILAPASNESLAYQNDSIMRQAPNKPITSETTDAIISGNKLTLEDFPSDETILNELRSRVADPEDETTITIEGKKITSEYADYLTTEYFAIRWYVLKYNNADAWHIDGVLVAKRAHAVITKTFAGDKEAIAEVKKNYQISITHDVTGGETQQDYVLTLHSAAEEKHANHFGYTSYDEATDTYTWVLTGRQGRTYTAKEMNYYIPPDTPDAQKYHGTYQYMIRNSENRDTPDWTNYSEEKGVSLVAQAYVDGSPTDSYQTVSFRNIYTSAGSISISKIDAATGFGLKDVEFTITKSEADSPMTLYQKMEGSVATSYYADEKDNNYTEPVNTVKTDANGMLYVKLSAGTYTLAETKPPTGYDGPSTITITVDDTGKITESNEEHDSTLQLKSTSNNWVIVSGENNATLTIKNTSKILLTVTAKKEWLDTDKTNWKTVTVSLYRNGVKMSGDKYTQELSEENNWVYTWDNLPLYVDDAVAEYSLREEKISDTAYEADNGSNGYRDYLVEYEPTKYLETLGDNNTNPLNADWTKAQTNATWTDTDGTHYARHALLVVKNKTAQSDIIFKKTDSLGNDLADAIFGIYSDEACTNLVSTSESDAQGYVRFTSKSGEEHFAYIKEIQAPSGCTLNNTVYRVTIPAGQNGDNNRKITFEKQVAGENGTFTYEQPDTTVDSDGKTYMVATNSSHINLQIKKVDNNGKPLPGATFTIEKFDGTSYVDFGKGTYTVKDKETGIVQITDKDDTPLTFPEGKYKITETETPSSLYRNAGQIIVTVQGGQVYYDKESSDDDSTDIDSWKMERKDGTVTYTLQVANTPWWSLPSTGGSGILLPIVFGSALMCGASALALWLRKRRKNNSL